MCTHVSASYVNHYVFLYVSLIRRLALFVHVINNAWMPTVQYDMKKRDSVSRNRI